MPACKLSFQQLRPVPASTYCANCSVREIGAADTALPEEFSAARGHHCIAMVVKKTSYQLRVLHLWLHGNIIRK